MMAKHYTQGHVDALGRRISDEDWAADERWRANYAAQQQATETARAANAPDPLSWGEIGAGLAGSAGRGATIGFSDYFNNGLKDTTTRFANQYPVTAGLANLLGAIGGMAIGTAEEGLGLRALQLAGRGVEAISPGLARVGGGLLSRLTPSTIPIVGKIAPNAIKSAEQGAIYAYNTSNNNDPDSLGRAGEAAVLGGILGPLAGFGVSRINGLVNSAGVNANRAVKQTLDATGLDAPKLINKLSQLSSNARAYDADPTALGAGGILSNIARVYPKFTPTIRNTAAEDIADIGAASRGLTQQYLGDTLPSTYTDFEAQLQNARSNAAAPLYDAANQTRIDLAGHPDLMNNFVLGNRFADYLSTKRGQLLGDAAATRNIDNFLARRNNVLNAGDQALRAVDTSTLPDEMLNDIHRGAISRHIAANNVDLSVPRPLVRGYLDELQESIPPEQASKNIQQTFQSLEPDSPNSVERFINDSKQAMQAVSPAEAAAATEYARMSTPLNQVDWARNLTRRGSQTKLGSEVTDDYIAQYNNIRNALSKAGLPDNSQPLNRYVLDESVLNASKGEPGLTPSAIINTITPSVKPRLEAVFGQEPVNNLIRDAKINDQLINNRMGLSRIGYPDDGNTGHMVFLPNMHATIDKAIGYFKNLVDTQKDKALMEFLQSNPEAAIKHISDYLRKFPNGTQAGYVKYLNAAAGNIAGRVPPPTYIDTDDYRRP